MTVESQAPFTPASVRTRLARSDRLHEAIQRSCRLLIDLQAGAGYWVGELEADTTLESDYILFHLWMDPPSPDGGWSPREIEKIREASCYIRERQTKSGGWNIYAGGPDELTASVKAYFALKLAGDPPEAPHMQAARQRVLELGGIERANSFARIYFSFFGLYDRDKIPTIPPELILLPPSTYINIYEMSSWSRAILVPLSILCARRPLRPVPAGFTLSELFSGSRDEQPQGSTS